MLGKTDPRYVHRQKQQATEADRRSSHEKKMARGRGEQPMKKHGHHFLTLDTVRLHGETC